MNRSKPPDAGTRIPCDRRLLAELFAASGAERWAVPFATFSAAVDTAVERRFRGEAPSSRDVDLFVRSLHAQDLALACACREGHEEAWDHLVLTVRPQLYAAARALAARGLARELVDSLWGDLYAGRSGDAPRSLLAYYHGRAPLAAWLRAVLAQRHVDGIRASARTVALDEQPPHTLSSPAPPPDPHARMYVVLAQQALDTAIDALDSRDRLRLRLYYGQQLTLAQIGRMLGEHEATVSRAVTRARRDLRGHVVRTLREAHGLSDAAIAACLDEAARSPELSALRVLLDVETGSDARTER